MTDDEFKTNIRMIAALAFVPTDDIYEAFDTLSDQCLGNEAFVIDYFEINYIGKLRRGRRRAPRFAHEV